MPEPAQWRIQPIFDLPEWFTQAVNQHSEGLPSQHLAQLLWQREIREPEQLAGFLHANQYQPTSAFEFGDEMRWAIARLQQARAQGEAIAIWGDFDADGITATAVLWDGLGQFFGQHQTLSYVIPNRLTDSHGLAIAGIDQLAAQGCRLIVTCDTGSTNLPEIDHARRLGIDMIVTDHHTLPAARPPVVAIVNPRYLPSSHPLATLSGVAVAYKLVEALYETLPEVPSQPLERLLDLVAIGLIADLVELKGDCRYLAQKGIERLQLNQKLNPPPRPGIAKLLEYCRRAGDRPTDISFGLGPRINAISRIHGDARFGVELLTSQDPDYCRQLADETELANVRRKSLQKDVAQQVTARLSQLDLSTTSIIVLEDSQWSVGVLGLVAGQMAQDYGRPTVLLSRGEDAVPSQTAGTDALLAAPLSPPLAPSLAPSIQQVSPPIQLARGSARSINQIDLYQLVKDQSHLLRGFGGHPFAAGLSLPVENIPLLAEAMNRQLRQQQLTAGVGVGAVIQADLVVTVAELGQELFRELKLLEPCGMGNPVPKLLIKNCRFDRVWHKNIQDFKRRTVRYIKTEFEITDDTNARFPGVWWGHYKDEIPSGWCDAIAELDFNSYEGDKRGKHYEIRLIAVRSAQAEQPHTLQTHHSQLNELLDWRDRPIAELLETATVLLLTQCPASWDELQESLDRAIAANQQLAIAYTPPDAKTPDATWQMLIGIAKYLSRTAQSATRKQLLTKLNIGDRPLQLGLQVLTLLGFEITPFPFCELFASASDFLCRWDNAEPPNVTADQRSEAIAQFLAAVREDQFRRQYFYRLPLSAIQTFAELVGRR